MRHRWLASLLSCLLLIGMAQHAIGSSEPSTASPTSRHWNVLMIAVDDLNDWIGPLGGHPQAQTPNLDRLARHAVSFQNAHCQAPICNPSRASLLTGTLPSNSGIYYLGPLLRSWQATRDATTLPQHFQQHGYATLGAGKIFHGQDKAEFQEYAGNFGGFGPRPPKNLNCSHVNPLWDWGAFPDNDAVMPDARLAAWTARQLHREHDRPFFLACGFYRPHVPLYVPQKWFDLYPLDELQLPAHRPDDLADVPQYGQDLSWSARRPTTHLDGRKRSMEARGASLFGQRQLC